MEAVVFVFSLLDCCALIFLSVYFVSLPEAGGGLPGARRRRDGLRLGPGGDQGRCVGTREAAGAGSWARAAGVASPGRRNAQLLPRGPRGPVLSGGGSWPFLSGLQRRGVAVCLPSDPRETGLRFSGGISRAGPLVGSDCPRPGVLAPGLRASRGSGAICSLSGFPGHHPRRPPLCSRGSWNLQGPFTTGSWVFSKTGQVPPSRCRFVGGVGKDAF